MKEFSQENSEVISGYFRYKLYISRDYMVYRFESEDGPITVTGPFFEADPKEKYTLKGQFVEHPKYGFQFSYTSIGIYMPSEEEGIITFLSSDIFKGIGKKAAEKIYRELGPDCLELLKNDISIADELSLTLKQKDALREGFLSLGYGDNELLFILLSAGFTNYEAGLISGEYKDDAAIILRSDPYLFYLNINGISFKRILEITRNMEFDDKELLYKRAFVIYLVKELCFNSGDSYLTYEDIAEQYRRYYDDPDIPLAKAIEEGYLIKDEDRYYDSAVYHDEFAVAERLLMQRETLPLDEDVIVDSISNFENSDGLQFDEYQKEAIYSFFKNRISIVTGGPGSGKTTLIKAIVALFQEHFPYHNLIVAAPTGRAAKRIAEICDVESSTIHSLLKWNKETDSFVHNEDNPILYDALIIDEFSMVDISLFSALLKASSYVKKICIIGDPDQLPSIRPGNVLHDVIDSNMFTVTRLLNNHRQSEGSGIIDLAKDIRNGNVMDLNYQDVSFINRSDANIPLLISSLLESGCSIDDIQVLSPMYKGDLGIDNLNSAIQNVYNPHSSMKEKKAGKQILREGDKILQLKNRANDDVYNGDIGILEEISDTDRSIMVNYQGTLVFYPFDDLDDITLAYCMSVHKSQGNEYRNVILICYRSHISMINRKLLYTAVTRARCHLSIVGDFESFMSGVSRQLKDRRTTLIRRLENVE